MKSILFVCLSGILISVSCSKSNDSIPPCINDKIALIRQQPKWNPPAEVNEYIYRGRHVFLFSSDCCDRYDQLYDVDCNFICAPSGGISGGGDGQCTDFFTSANFVKLVWKDSR